MTLAGYVIRSVLGYTALVITTLLVLLGLYLFLTQTDELGVGNYGVLAALVVVLCRLPEQAFMLLPIAALMGALLALGNLARSSELIVMRVSGISVFRLAGWVAFAGLLLTVVTWLIGDYVAPPAARFASQYKMMAKTNQYNAIPNDDMWAKDGNVFLSVQRQSGEQSFGGVYLFKFDEQRRLQSVGRADTAELAQGQSWRLRRYVETRFDTQPITATAQPLRMLETGLSIEFLRAAVAEPDTLTSRALWNYIGYLRSNKLETTEYSITLWARIARTCALPLIVMLAVPFAFGPMRATGIGTRMVVGILVGATFFLLAKLFSNAGVVYGLRPLIVAWGPTTVLGIATLLALLRVR